MTPLHPEVKVHVGLPTVHACSKINQV